MSKSKLLSLDNISSTDLRQRIKSLQNADFKKLSDEQVWHRVARIIDQYPLQVRTVEISGAFRARKNIDGKDFLHTKELWYPEAKCITRPSRLNSPDQVRFYAASMANTTIFELRLKE